MSVQRILLGGAGNPKLDVPIPKYCQDHKTIVLPITKEKLYIYKDTTSYARTYLYEVLPTLLTKNWTPEKTVKWFYELPDYCWLEFEIHNKLLYLCSLKK